MDRTIERAYAKINLTLGVLYKRTDGYHALDSVMQSVSLFDTVTVEKSRGIAVTATGMTLPYDNTLRRAAEQYRALTGRGATIRAVKRIPAEAGLGGGSADAAAVLNGMQKLYGEVDESSLFALARRVGADVPFCMRGGTQRAEGVGEVLTPIRGMALHFVVVKPEGGVSTRRLFSSLTLPRRMPDNAACLKALAQNDLDALCLLLFNALEESATALVPEIGAAKAALLGAGARAACMSGSGSAVFGVFESAEAAQAAADGIRGFAFCAACESVL